MKRKDLIRQIERLGCILIRHGGVMNGFMTNLERYVDERNTIILLSNYRPVPLFSDLTSSIRDVLYGREPTLP